MKFHEQGANREPTKTIDRNLFATKRIRQNSGGQ